MTKNAYNVTRPYPYDLIAQVNEFVDKVRIWRKMGVEDIDFAPLFDAMLVIALYYQAKYVCFDAYDLYTFEDDSDDGWPLAWRLAECYGIKTACGNSGHHQISWPKICGDMTDSNNPFLAMLGVYHVPTRERVAGPPRTTVFRIHSLEKKIVGKFDWKKYLS